MNILKKKDTFPHWLQKKKRYVSALVATLLVRRCSNRISQLTHSVFTTQLIFLYNTKRHGQATWYKGQNECF